MKIIMYFFTLLLSTKVWAQEPETFSLVEEGSKISKESVSPVGSVDDKGEVKWTYPPGYFEQKEQEMKKELQRKSAAETEAEKRKLKEIMKKKMDNFKERTIASSEPVFNPADDSGRQIKGTAQVLGYYYGANIALLYRQGHWSYGVMGKYSASSNVDTGSRDSVMGLLGQGAYHLFPRWYTDSLSHKVLDPYVNFALGFGSSSSSSGALVTTGLGASYPLSKGFKAYGEYEIMMFEDANKVHGSYSLGLSWEF